MNYGHAVDSQVDTVNLRSKYGLIATISDTIIDNLFGNLWSFCFGICHFQIFYVRHSYFRNSSGDLLSTLINLECRIKLASIVKFHLRCEHSSAF